MQLAKVIGTVVSTSKDSRLVGSKLLLTQRLNADLSVSSYPPAISIDTVGAGVGELVIITTGNTARYATNRQDSPPVDSAIVGIVDSLEVDGKAKN